MTGTEKQIVYASNLRNQVVEAFDTKIAAFAAEGEGYETQIETIATWRNNVAAFDGDAGKFIVFFKKMGRTADYQIARCCYRDWAARMRL